MYLIYNHYINSTTYQVKHQQCIWAYQLIPIYALCTTIRYTVEVIFYPPVFPSFSATRGIEGRFDHS